MGLSISKVPRTGKIREAETYFDYISLKAFLKEAMKLTSHNERITHWIPVFFGKGDNEERFFFFLKRALSMIMTNSTKNFQPEFVLDVFPKLIITIAYHIMDKKKHPSIRALRVLTHVHSMFLFCMKKFPELVAKVQDQLKSFMSSEENRVKSKL